MMENGKKYLRRIMLVAMAFLLCTVCSMETKSAKAASRPTVRVTKRTKKEATIKISKSKATGYQVYLSASKHGSYKLLMATRTQYYKITGLKANKTYYVKVRGYRTRGYRISRGKYSKAVKINIYKKAAKKSTKKTTTTTNTTTESLTEATTAALNSINTERQNRGLTALTSDAALFKSADTRAQELAQSFGHTRPDGREFQTVLEDASYDCEYATEDIYTGTTNLEEVLTKAMTDVNRAENIFSSEVKKIAVGYCYNEATATGYWAILITE